MSIFPEDDKERQKYPVGQFIRDFFPHAIAALARHSWENQQKHTPGSTTLTWAKDKSIGTGDQLLRHFMDGEYVHTAWRALELLERQLTGMPPFEGLGQELIHPLGNGECDHPLAVHSNLPVSGVAAEERLADDHGA